MARRFAVQYVAWPLTWLALKAWGRRWITTSQCRAVTTAVARVVLVGQCRTGGQEREGEGRDGSE